MWSAPIQEITGEEAGFEPLLVVNADGLKEDDPIMKYLDASTRRRANERVKGWDDTKEKFGVVESEQKGIPFLNLTEALAVR